MRDVFQMIGRIAGSRPAGLVAVWLVTGFAACGAESPPLLSVDDGTVVVVGVDSVLEGPPYSGVVVSERMARLRSDAAAMITDVLVQSGDSVAAGAVLLRFDDRALRGQGEAARSAVAQAESAVAQAAREVDRARALTAIGAMALRDREGAERVALGARTLLAEGRARQLAAERALDHTVVRAPFAGVVTELPVAAGELVAPGMPLVTVADARVRTIEGWMSLPNAEVLRGKREVAISAYTSGPAGARVPVWLPATVRQVSPVVDQQTRQVRVRVALSDPDVPLLIGQGVQGRVAVATRRAVLVPELAIDVRDTVSTVAVVRGGVVVRTSVVLGARISDARQVEILRGVSVGDSVLVGEARFAPAGSPVRAAAAAAAAAALPVAESGSQQRRGGAR